MADSRSRKERMADPERWYQFTSMSDGEKCVDVEGHELMVKGRIDDIIIVSLPREARGSASDIAAAMTSALRESGIARDVIVVPEQVKMLKLRPISLAQSKKLDRMKRHADAKHRADMAKVN